MGQQVQSMPGPSLKDTADIVYVAACVHSACFTPFLRTGMGVRGLSWFGPLGLVWMLIYAQATRCGPLMLYLPCWLFACFMQSAILKSRREHSRYQGFPILGRFRGEHSGLALEILLLFVAGGYLYTLDQTLGEFVFFGGAALFVKQSFDRARVMAAKLAAHDAQIDAQWRTGMHR